MTYHPIPIEADLPPLNERVQVYLAGHDQLWAYARLIDPDVWEIDSRELPSHVSVDRGLITHWMPEPPSPLDTFVIDGPQDTYVIDGEVAITIIDAGPPKITERRALPTK